MSVSVLVSGSPTVVADQLPAGAIVNLGDVFKIYSGSVWLNCDGSAVSRTTYAQLFAAIGTTFGPGDGVTTFNLPSRAQGKGRPVVQVTTNTTFAQFIDDTDIVVNNTGSAWIDISAGAVDVGTRVSIVEQNANGVTVYTNSGHTQSCLLPQGTIALEWDGTQWCLVGESIRIRTQITSNTTWYTPFSANYTLTPVGGGGGGGGAANPGAFIDSAGGGAGGGISMVTIPLSAGTGLVVSIGSGGAGGSGAANGGNGGNTTITFGSTVASGPGGSGGNKATASGANGIGLGATGGSMVPTLFGQTAFPGRTGAAGTSGGPAGDGGDGPWQLGTGGHGGAAGNNHNGSAGTGLGSGGGGANAQSTNQTGGAGTAGCAFIEF